MEEEEVHVAAGGERAQDGEVAGGKPGEAEQRDAVGKVDEREFAWNPAAQLREILARTERDIESKGIDCATHTGSGDPAKALVEIAEKCNADLLVIGNKGMNRRVLGSVPNTVAHRANCSVLVVKTT